MPTLLEQMQQTKSLMATDPGTFRIGLRNVLVSAGNGPAAILALRDGARVDPQTTNSAVNVIKADPELARLFIAQLAANPGPAAELGAALSRPVADLMTETSSSGLMAFLTKPVGPLPVYGWGLVAGAVVAGVYFFRRP